jgi:hypothetical protein
MAIDDQKTDDLSEKEYQDKIIDGFAKSPEVIAKEAELVNFAKEKIKGVSDELPEEFNVKHIGDLSYLLEIFSSKYDKYHSLDYLQKTRDSLLEDGYSDGSMLNEFLFWSTMSRKMQIIYQRMHAKLNRKKGVNEDDAENLSFLKEMRAVSGQVSSLQNSLDGALDKRKKIKDVVDLHDETMHAAEEFIKTHIGEYTFRCKKCGTIVNSQGLPHFAITTELDDKGEVVYYVFSPELWFLFRKKLVPLHVVAFILRTSPEGVVLTAEQRKEYGSQVLHEDMKILEEEEDHLRILAKEYADGLKTT